MIKNKQNNNWEKVQIGKLLDYEQPTNYIVSSTDYEDGFKMPVLTAGKTFILGYTDEENNIFPKEKLPVIIFDDFTTANKFVDFEFKVKSSAMKILKNKNESISDVTFIFGAMQLLNFQVGEHKRNYLSEYQYLDIPLPPLPEQKRIVGVLEVWDEYLEKLKSKIDVKKNIKKYLMQELLTGKKRLEGFGGEWVEKKLGEVCNVSMGQSPESKNYNECGDGTVLIQGNADLKKSKTISRVYTTQITKIAEIGDIIFTVRAPVGSIGYVVQEKVCIGRGVCSIKATNGQLDFIFYKLAQHKNDFLRYEQGSTFSAINGKDIRNFGIKIPSLEEQKVIAAILMVADEELEGLLCKQRLLEEQKRFLLNNLISGVIRVPENLVANN